MGYLQSRSDALVELAGFVLGEGWQETLYGLRLAPILLIARRTVGARHAEYSASRAQRLEKELYGTEGMGAQDLL